MSRAAGSIILMSSRDDYLTVTSYPVFDVKATFIIIHLLRIAGKPFVNPKA
jgi:hypothetical protein